MRCVDAHVLVHANRPEAPDHERYAAWLDAASSRGNLVPDAYLAAMAVERDAVMITADRGFARFEGLRWRHPFDDTIPDRDALEGGRSDEG